MAVVSLFGDDSGVSLGEDRLLEDISLSLDIYLFLIPYVTFVPIAAILNILLSMKVKQSTSSKPKLAKCVKIIRYIGIFLLILCCLGSAYIIISVSSNSTHNENL